VNSKANPAGLGSRILIPLAAVAAVRKPDGTSSGRGKLAFRIISTMTRRSTGQKLDRLDERDLLHMHGKVDGATATGSGTRVVPLGSRCYDLKLTARGQDMPSTRGGLFDGPKGLIRSAADRKPQQSLFACHLAKSCQRGSIK
jgi:hypothetical protein